jgi:N-acetylmuramoyl-L-alanine amidase
MRLFASIILLVVSTLCSASPVQVSGARAMDLPDGTQLSFELSAPIKYDSFLLDNPPRLVIDLRDARMSPPGPELTLGTTDVRSVRTGIQDGKNLRIVVDLGALMRSEVQTVRDVTNGGFRLVVDVFRRDKPPASRVSRSGPPIQLASVQNSHAPAQPTKTNPKPPLKPVPPKAAHQTTTRRESAQTRSVARTGRKSREVVIVIDPGHGGKDPGAIGPRGTQEKQVVMQIAKLLQKLVNRESGMRAVLTRTTDKYLYLYDRIRNARQHEADLFISLHADAVPNRDAHGSSVYILSSGRATSVAAKMLADRENAVDRIGGGVHFAKADDVNSVLIDMHQEATLEASLFLGEQVIKQLGKVGSLHKHQVERASFAVLTSPVMPSILVETAFITNPDEERKLRRRDYQERIAGAIMKGIHAYFRKRPPRQLLVDLSSRESPMPYLDSGFQMVSTGSTRSDRDGGR